jgi:hypothetical protein
MTNVSHSFNPLDRVNLGRSVEQALLRTPCEPLPPTIPFEGAGLYALYYQGPFPLYDPISYRDCEIPIYVGRAVPRGARQGRVGLGEPAGRVLFNRLREHADSIAAAANLEVEDFRCRYLIVDDIWVPLAEALLIGHFRPLWNRVVDGFGNHDPGGGRRQQARSPWDVLHPGRRWAALQAEGLNMTEIKARVDAHFAGNPPSQGVFDL